jgi:hypothetical protein
MTTTQIIISVAVAVAIIVALAASRSGPRVTRIDRTVREKKGGDDA